MSDPGQSAPDTEGRSPNATGLRWTLWTSLHRLRTEGRAPARQALAVGVGLFIGCTPLYGLHLALSVAAGWLLRVNRLLVYAAAHISNPVMAPFLLVAELQAGAWVRRQQWLGPRVIAESGLSSVASDLAVGSAVVGLVAGAVGGGLTFALVRRRARHPAVTALVERTALRYLQSGWTTWEATNGKLQMDAVYLNVLSSGRLPQRGALVDLGCGRGLMLALLATARELYAGGTWPQHWPSPPVALDLRGIETRPRMVAQARQALAGMATVEQGDIREISLPRCDAVLLFDVLHLMDATHQDRCLSRIAAALPEGGLLVLREADADAGWPFQIVRWSNWGTRALQGQWERRFHFRSAAQWRHRLQDLGFQVEPTPAGRGAPLGNVLLFARRGTAKP